MKRPASIDNVALAILRATSAEKLREPNKCAARPAKDVLNIALTALKQKFEVRDDEWRAGQNKVEAAGCFERYVTFDGKGEIKHMWLSAKGETLLTELVADEEKKEQVADSALRWRVTVLLTFAGLAATAIVFIYHLYREP